MSLSTAIIGRVAVKVMPHTKDFRKDTERELTAIEKSLSDIIIGVKLDTDGIVAEAVKARDAAQKAIKDVTIKVNLDDTGSVQNAINRLRAELVRLGETDLKVTLNEDEINAALELLDERLQDLRTIDLRVNLDDAGSVRSTLKSIQNEIDKFNETELKVKVDQESLTAARELMVENLNKSFAAIRQNVEKQLKDIPISTTLDPAEVRRAVRELDTYIEQIERLKLTITPEMDDEARRDVERKIDRLKEQVEEIKSVIKPEVGLPSSVLAAVQLANLTRDRFVDIRPVVNAPALATAATALAALAGGRVLNDFFDKYSDWLKNLDKSVPLIGTVAEAIAGLAGFGLTAASNLFALSSSLAQIGPAALALPGIFGGMAIGTGVMVAALKDFTTVFPDVQQAFTDMQDTISSNFWAKAMKPMREMLDIILPQLAAGFAQTATALGGYFAGLAAGVTGTLSAALAGMFIDLAESIKIATAGTQGLIGVITTLGTVGAGYLPSLAGWFVRITDQFDAFLSKAADDGRLVGWIDNGIFQLKELGRAFSGLGGILAGLGKAAEQGGGSTLTMLADTLEAVSAAVNSPAFQSVLVGVLQQAHLAMTTIATISGPAFKTLMEQLGETLQTVLPAAASAIGPAFRAIFTALGDEATMKGIVAMFDGLGVGIRALAPTVEDLGPVLGKIGEVIGELAANLGPLLGEAIEAVTPLLLALGDAAIDLADPLSEALTAIVSDLGPVLKALVITVELLTPALTLLLEVAEPLAPVIVTLGLAFLALKATMSVLSFVGMIQTLLVMNAGIIASTLALAGNLVGWVATGAAALVAGAQIALAWIIAAGPALLLIAAIALVVAAVVGLGILIYKYWDEIAALTSTVWAAVSEFFVTLWNGIVEVFTSAVGSVIGFFTALPGQVMDAITAFPGMLLDFIVLALNAVLTAVMYWIAALIVIYYVIPKKIVEALKEFGPKMLKVITDAWAKFTEWTVLQTVAFIGFMKELPGKVYDALKDFGAKFKDTAVSAWNAYGIYMDEKRAALIAWFKELPGRVKDALAEFGTKFKDTAVSAWNAYGIYMDEKRGALIAWFKALPGMVKDALKDFGSKMKDTAVSAWNAYGIYMDEKRASLLAWFRELPGKVKDALSGAKDALLNAGRDIIQGFIRGIDEKVQKIKDKLREVTNLLPSWKGPATLDRVILEDAGRMVIDGFINGLESRYGAVKKSLGGLTDEIGDMDIVPPSANINGSVSGRVGSIAAAASGSSQEGSAGGKVLNYYAAPGAGLSSEEDLYAAAGRARMVGW